MQEMTPSPPSTANGLAPLWTLETPHTTTQLEQQARLIRDYVQRQPQSPTSQAINQLVKGCQMAMHSAVILARENSELRIANQRRKQKQQQRRRYIAQGGVLQAEQGQLLVQSLESAEQEEAQEEAQRKATQVRQRAPPCSKCHIQGHSRRQCTSN